MAGSSRWVAKLRQISGAAARRDLPFAAAHHQQRGCVRGPRRRGAERVGPLRSHQRDGGAAVLEEILDGVGLELRVDHHYDGADLQDAEQGRHVVRPVGQGDDHALFRRHSRRTEHVGIAVGQCLHLTVGPPSGIGQQRGAVAPTFAHPGIEKEVGDVQVRRLFVSHAEPSARATIGEDTITVQPLAAMTWEEARDAAGPGSVAVLPVGAIEAHGPHLPLETDVIIAQAMARAGAARLAAGGARVVMLPPLTLYLRGVCPGFRRARSRSGPRRSRRSWWTSRAVWPVTAFGVLAIANAHLDPAHLASLAAAATPIRGDLGMSGRVPQPGGQALGAPTGRGVPERRLPRRPVRDVDGARRAAGAGARGDDDGAARESGVALPRHPRGHARASRRRAATAPTSGLRRRRRRGRPRDRRSARRDSRRSGPHRAGERRR